MSLFQKSVLEKYLTSFDKNELNLAYEKFLSIYNSKKIEKIKKLKEEEYQDGFLRDLFVKVLGYTLKPDENFNMVREFKNQKDNKKADAAILKKNKAIAVIELKSTKTKDLRKVTEQAFNYRNNQINCRYIITSNFHKLRFFIDYASDFEEFNLFNLKKNDFNRFYILLNKKSILNHFPLKLKEETKFHEEKISNELYKDYSILKSKIFENLVLRNKKIDKLILFKKSQKLLDRLLFIFFAQDIGLLPINTIKKIIDRFFSLQKLDAYKPLYEVYKQYFSYMNEGRNFEDENENISAYNGGLFAEDEILDKLIIDDKILWSECLKISKYNFKSEVDVNILGHIFEHSLNEMEEMNAKIEGKKLEKKKSKRKKDGVFYTPKYITTYIIENTIGKICMEKYKELEILEIEFDNTFRRKDGKLNKKGKELFKKLEDYKNWLLSLKILDPACGSGAFLNEALNFLIKEHQKIDNIIVELTQKPLRIYDTDKSILEQNLFGVDINEESVEIAKLSLWLRTAKKGRKLSSLNNNIKCGNSLIDDKKIAGEKAFIWEKEFKEIMKNGGFDIIVGNPPYVKLQGLKANYQKESFFYKKKYKSATSNYDIYVLFIEKSLELIKQNGDISFILPHKFLISEFGKGIRKLLAEKKAIKQLLNFGSEMVFSDASTYTCILNLSFNNLYLEFKQLKPLEITKTIKFDKIKYDKLGSDKWNLNSKKITNILEKLNKQPFKVKDIFARISQGIASGADNIFLIKGKKGNNLIKGYSKALDKIIEIESDLVKPILKGEDVAKYKNLKNNYFVIFPYFIKKGKGIQMTEEYIKINFPKAYQYLKENENYLRNREKGKFNNSKEWFLFSRKQGMNEVEQAKIIMRNFSFGSELTFDNEYYYHNTNVYSLIKKDKLNYLFYLSILNSKLMWFFMKYTSPVIKGGFVQYKTIYVNKFPLPKIVLNYNLFEEIADKMLSLNKSLEKEKNNFLLTLQEETVCFKITKKLNKFYLLDFKNFKSELKKQKIKFSFNESNIWRNIFNEVSEELNKLEFQINETDKIIDKMVYKLYNLNDEEIKIICEN